MDSPLMQTPWPLWLKEEELNLDELTPTQYEVKADDITLIEYAGDDYNWDTCSNQTELLTDFGIGSLAKWFQPPCFTFQPRMSSKRAPPYFFLQIQAGSPRKELVKPIKFSAHINEWCTIYCYSSQKSQ
jgi:hypothetical protein